MWMSPDPPVSGDPVTVGFRVVNIGNEIAGGFRVLFSKTNVPTTMPPTDVEIVYCIWIVSGLPPGGFFEGDSDTLPSECAGDPARFPTAFSPGFTLALTVDEYDTVEEADENNNQLSRFISILSPPPPPVLPPVATTAPLYADVKVNGGDSGIFINQGDSITVTWTTQNFGSPDASCVFRNHPPGSILEGVQPLFGTSTVQYATGTPGIVELTLTCYDGLSANNPPRALDSVLLYVEPPPLPPPPPLPLPPPVEPGFEVSEVPITPVKTPATSTKFSIGDRVIVTANINVRDLPLLDSATLIGTHASGTLGTVIDGPVWSGGFWWWKIDYDAAPDGWSVENFLELNYLLWNYANIHSPMVVTYHGQRFMFLGGWLSDYERTQYQNTLKGGIAPSSIAGLEKIYMSAFVDGKTWYLPQKVFEKKGSHVHHPSIIHPPVSSAPFGGTSTTTYTVYGQTYTYANTGTSQSNLLAMYYSDRNNALIESGDTTSGSIGLATSDNGGVSWSDRGIIIGSSTVSGGGWNGYNDFGGSSPSAIVANNEVWVYFQTNEPTPKIIRTRFALDGRTILGIDRVELPAEPFVITHVDVSHFATSSKYLMVANSREQNYVVEYMSQDGRIWFKTAGSPRLSTAGSEKIVTPHREVVDENNYRIYAGWNRFDGYSHEIRMWEFRTPAYVLAATVPTTGMATTSFGGPETYTLTCYNAVGEFDSRQRTVTETTITQSGGVRTFAAGDVPRSESVRTGLIAPLRYSIHSVFFSALAALLGFRF